MSDVTAALITAKETVTFRTFTQAPPPPGCVTIDIRLCGICGTDIHSFSSGHLHSPAVCGHEWVGTVAKEVTVVASNAFTHDDVRRAMTFLADGRVQAQPLHSRTVRLDELEATLRGLSAGPSDDIKILVDPRPS